jgi:hypothetical protein
LPRPRMVGDSLFGCQGNFRLHLNTGVVT